MVSACSWQIDYFEIRGGKGADGTFSFCSFFSLTLRRLRADSSLRIATSDGSRAAPRFFLFGTGSWSSSAKKASGVNFGQSAQKVVYGPWKTNSARQTSSRDDAVSRPTS
jgi:hypothetical protein